MMVKMGVEKQQIYSREIQAGTFVEHVARRSVYSMR